MIESRQLFPEQTVRTQLSVICTQCYATQWNLCGIMVKNK